MLALTASALLGLYVFLPIALFDKLAGPFVRLKKNQRTRTEEVVAGMLVAVIPFGLTLFCSRYFWHVGHWPFSLSDAEAVGKIGDYKTVFSSLYSDHYFDDHSTQFWLSLRRVLFHQCRFVSWNYGFLLAEIAIVFGITFYYGYLNKSVFFRKTVGRLLLSRVSEWTPLLTTFLFDPTEKRRVEVDLMAANGILLRGTVSDHFIDKDGGLRGLLLKDAKRYQYSKLQEDRRKNQATALSDYWKPIPGANFYVPYDKTVTLNLRYELPEEVLLQRLMKALDTAGMSNAVISVRMPSAKVAPESSDSEVPGPSDK
jgi:hypothetical protein